MAPMASGGADLMSVARCRGHGEHQDRPVSQYGYWTGEHALVLPLYVDPRELLLVYLECLRKNMPKMLVY